MAQPRGAAREQSILATVYDLLNEVGYDRLSVDTVASTARASKATIYARWPDKARLVAAALDARSQELPSLSSPATSLRDDITQYVRLVVGLAETESLSTFIGVLIAAQGEKALADTVRGTALEPRRRECWDMVQRAIGRGELDESAAAVDIFEIVFGKILVRYLLEQRPLSADEIQAFADDLVLPVIARKFALRPAHPQHGKALTEA
ncbi:MAG: TetR/AcrR family transcriptional regulator [Cellulomonadaceae bacterium]|nr:TetR/AcrR family transcriptional regulator [Cellulomonadaceae bacterium]